jgi:hypothetical protein
MEKGKLRRGTGDQETSAKSDKSFDKFSRHQTLEHSGRKICVIKKNLVISVKPKQSLEQANELVGSC